MFNTLRNVKIAAIRAVVPKVEIKLEDESEYYGGSLKKVARLRKTLGMDRRRVCPPDVTASDLCSYGAASIFDTFPEAKCGIDALIFVSQNPDWHQPATACELQHRLGLPKTCATFDINQGCSGYIYGLWVASSLIASGGARQTLVLVGDAHTAGRDLRNRVTTPVFGDAGSATLLLRDDNAPPMYFGLGTDGSEFESIITPAGKARIPFLRFHDQNECLVCDNADPSNNIWQLSDTYMDGGSVYTFTMDVVPPHIERLLTYAGKNKEDVNWLMLHQANKQIVENIAAKSGIPDSLTPSQSFSKYGNTASASIPLAICDELGNTPDPGLILMCGYGIGLSWASCLCDIKNWNCEPPLEFEPDLNRPTRQQRIERWQKILKGEINRHDQI